MMDFPGEVRKNETFAVAVAVGKEIPHPNKSEHFIAWISLYFKPAGKDLAYELGTQNFSAHGASTDGPNSIIVHTEPQAVFQIKVDQPGVLIATSYCNIHGLWESSRELAF